MQSEPSVVITMKSDYNVSNKVIYRTSSMSTHSQPMSHNQIISTPFPWSHWTSLRFNSLMRCSKTSTQTSTTMLPTIHPVKKSPGMLITKVTISRLMVIYPETHHNDLVNEKWLRNTQRDTNESKRKNSKRFLSNRLIKRDVRRLCLPASLDLLNKSPISTEQKS